MLTEPLGHQTTALNRADRREAFALFMEQGTGKTWVTLAEAEDFFSRGEISGLLIVALNGVHRNWIEREIPAHLSVPHVCLLWESSKSKTRHFTQSLIAFRRTPTTHLRIVAINVETFSRPPNDAINLAEEFLASGTILMAVDESDTIKAPGATRTRVLWRLGRKAKFRRILTGTPLTETPLNAYAQFKFLSPVLLGFNNYANFKGYFAEWRAHETVNGNRYEEIVRYRNLDELKTLIDANSFAVRKKDCLGIPDKTFQVRPVELSEETMRLYRAAKKKLIIECRTGTLTFAHALTRLTRLSQFAGGYFVTDDDPTPRPLSVRNPKIDSLRAYVNDLPADVKTIVWCRFVHEAVAVAASLGAEAVRYWGEISDSARSEAVNRFQAAAGPRYFVGTQKAGGRGLTLTAATQVVYFSNSFSLADRLQSEDRPHRIGQHNVVTYTDLLATGTIDERMYSDLTAKRELSDLFMGGTVEDLARWLEGQE